MNVGGAFTAAALDVIFAILSIIQWLVIIAAVITWLNPDPRNPIVQFLYRTTEPILRPFRRLLRRWAHPMEFVQNDCFLRLPEMGNDSLVAMKLDPENAFAKGRLLALGEGRLVFGFERRSERRALRA